MRVRPFYAACGIFHVFALSVDSFRSAGSVPMGGLRSFRVMVQEMTAEPGPWAVVR